MSHVAQFDASLSREVGVQPKYLDREGNFVDNALAVRLGFSPKFQIIRVIERALSVFVVDRFRFKQRSSQNLLHHMPMLKDSAAAYRNGTVACFMQMPRPGRGPNWFYASYFASVAHAFVMHAAQTVAYYFSSAARYFARLPRGFRDACFVAPRLPVSADTRVVSAAKAFGFGGKFTTSDAAKSSFLRLVNKPAASRVSVRFAAPEMHATKALRFYGFDAPRHFALPSTQVAVALTKCRRHEGTPAALAELGFSRSVDQAISVCHGKLLEMWKPTVPPHLRMSTTLQGIGG